MENKEFYSINEVAYLTNYDKRTIRDKCKNGIIKGHQMTQRGKWLIPASELERMKAEINESPFEHKTRKLIEKLPPEAVPMALLTTGQEVLNFVNGAHMFSYNNDNPKSRAEGDLISEFFQYISDLGIYGYDLPPKLCADVTLDLTKLLDKLGEKGFCVFGRREVKPLKGDTNSKSMNLSCVALHILRQDSEAIMGKFEVKIHDSESDDKSDEIY
jgi:excisionase family DNA binding protein